MLGKKSIALAMLVILTLPQVALAQSLLTINSANETNQSLEEKSSEELLTQRRRRGRRSKARRRRRRVRRNRSSRRGSRSRRRRRRRREFRREVRRYRRRETVGNVVTGIAGIAIGAAIAESNRRDESNTQVIITNQGNTLEDNTYYDDLYECQALDQGGYYDGEDSADECYEDEEE